MTPTLPTALAATLKNLPDRPGVYDDRMAEAARLLGLMTTSPQ